jgi:hypothetical protein
MTVENEITILVLSILLVVAGLLRSTAALWTAGGASAVLILQNRHAIWRWLRKLFSRKQE